MRVLVTGAAGFIGSHVTRRVVQEGHEVWAAILPGESTDRLTDVLDRLSVVAVDLRDGQAVRELVSAARPECAIHLAWYAVPGQYWTAPENLDCVAMSLNLAQALVAAGCSRLVAAGSCAEYDWSYGFLSEDVTPLMPRTLYGACKNATRQVLEAYCAQTSLAFAWTRFFYLYGPGEAPKRLVPSVILSLLRGETAKCTEGEQLRDFLHVEDAAAAVWAIAQSSLAGPVNIGSGQPVRIRSLVETLGRILEAGEKTVFGALPTDPAEPPFLVADVRRLKSHTAWEPIFVLDEGLRRTAAWWRERWKRT
ncbi:MAG: NAD(P)-dependent oxidoreductase [Terriglobia bacterium]|jgi:nucleoside-diphosphate-sugar epimerase